MKSFFPFFAAAGLMLAQACCDCPCAEPPLIAPESETAGGESTEPAAGGTTTSAAPATASAAEVNEARAVEIAFQLAEQEGYDPMEYSDVVVHPDGDTHWEVQLRKPRILRFLQVRVDRQSGAAELRVLTNTQ